jgi:hypothetical protein
MQILGALEGGLMLKDVRQYSRKVTRQTVGRFQVVFTTPVLSDGSWRRLADIASYYDLGFVLILVANKSDVECAEALENGAFDVVDPSHELPTAAEAAKRALWAAYLKGAGPRPEVASHPMAA